MTVKTIGSVDMTKVPWKDDKGNDIRICIDADCPSCGWPERNFNGEVFGCRKCEYTSTSRNE